MKRILFVTALVAGVLGAMGANPALAEAHTREKVICTFWEDGAANGVECDNGYWQACEEFEDGWEICHNSTGKIWEDPGPGDAD